MTAFGASLTNHAALLPQTRHCSYYVSRPTPRSDCGNMLIYAHKTSRSVSSCDVIPGSLTLPAPQVEDFVELILLCCVCCGVHERGRCCCSCLFHKKRSPEKLCTRLDLLLHKVFFNNLFNLPVSLSLRKSSWSLWLNSLR